MAGAERGHPSGARARASQTGRSTSVPVRIGLLAVVLLGPAPVLAQMSGPLGVGVSVTAAHPLTDNLGPEVHVRPFIRRTPVDGWGFAVSGAWYEFDVRGSPPGVDGIAGRLDTKVLMVGISHTWVRGRLGTTVSFVAGPAISALELDSRSVPGSWRVVGSAFEEKLGTLTVAARPGMGVTYAIAPRFGLTAFGAYLMNRPRFTLRKDDTAVATSWRGDALTLSGGAVVTLF